MRRDAKWTLTDIDVDSRGLFLRSLFPLSVSDTVYTRNYGNIVLVWAVPAFNEQWPGKCRQVSARVTLKVTSPRVPPQLSLQRDITHRRR